MSPVHPVPFCPRAWDIPFDRWRKQQRDAVRDVLDARTKFVVVQAPTGFGKTAVAGGILQGQRLRTAILTGTKSLQDQYGLSLPTILYDIRGMSNYECLAARDEFKRLFAKRRGTVTCGDGPCRSDVPCSLKERGCAYFDRYRVAMQHRHPSTSYAYWLSTRRYSRGLGPVPVLVCDEAHSIAEELMAACRIDLPFKDMERVRPPRSLAGWRQWASSRLEWFAQVQGDEVKVRNQHVLNRLKDIRDMDPETWAWESTHTGWSFEPVIPKLLLPLLCDDVQQKVVLLSATITPQALALLGISEQDITFLEYASTFPLARRPVYVLDSVRVDVKTFKFQPDAKPFWLNRIAQICLRRADRKGIIHTVSYARQRELADYLRPKLGAGNVFAPEGSAQLTHTLGDFRRAGPGAVLLSPSVTTGLDFPYTDAEFQIITKVPFPDTRSPIMKARVRANPGYAMHHVAQTIVQMTGRIVRAEDDQGETFVIDDNFRWAWGTNKALYPRWFNEAIQFVGRIPEGPEPLDRESED